MSNENSIFIRSITEYEDLKLKCLAKGRPKPTVLWFLKFTNGTSLRNISSKRIIFYIRFFNNLFFKKELDVDNSEIVIKNIKKTSKIDKVECQISNGFGPSVTRSFKVNIKR